MKAEELRSMTEPEIEEKLRGVREELFNLQFRLVTEQVENPLRIRLLRRDIARIMTVLQERRLRIERGEAGGPEATGPSPDLKGEGSGA